MLWKKIFSNQFQILFFTTLAIALVINAVPSFWKFSAQEMTGSHQDHSHLEQYQVSTRNPIIVIPGLLGSALENPQQEPVWGQLSFTSDFTQLALPMSSKLTLNSVEMVVGQVLPSLKANVFGLRFEQEVYRRILNALEADREHQNATTRLNTIDDRDDPITCFQFPYDWRQDNVKNAQRLHTFILEKRDDLRQKYQERYGIDIPDIKFDIVAHSMGGLVTRYFLRYGDRDLPENGKLPQVTWEGTRYIDRVILIAPPNAGSINDFVNLAYGTFANFPNFFSEPVGALGVLAGRLGIGPANLNSNIAVLSTFPSLYQMLPRNRHKPVTIVGSDGSRTTADLFKVEVWEKMQWGIFAPKADSTLKRLLPEVSSFSDRQRIARNMMVQNLRRAEQFTQALDQPAQPPSNLNLRLLAGNSVLTAQMIEVNQSGQFKVIKTTPGDGTVTRASAILDERTEENGMLKLQSPIPWSQTNFYSQDHLKLVQDSSLIDSLRCTLLGKPGIVE